MARDYPKRDYSKIDELPFVKRRAFFRTMAGPESTEYPSWTVCPATYYAERLIVVRFDPVVGADELEYVGSGQFAVIHNQPEANYIPEGTIVLCWQEYTRWYTVH